MKREERILYFENLCNALKNYSNEEIEKALMEYVKIKLKEENQLTLEYLQDNEICNVFFDKEFPIDIEILVEFFEYLLDKDEKNQNGIVFTPKYISDFIVKDSLNDITEWSKKIKIIDPGCGCGIFLISAIEFLHKKFNIKLKQIIENNIYGIDIMQENVRRCKFVMQIYCFLNNEEYSNLKTNIICADSLNNAWYEYFNVEKFDYIIGNPPYVNTHDLKEETIKLLKEKYYTTKEGVFNIFYAFIEEGMNNLSENGQLEFIIPNNFLTIKSALRLRNFITQNNYLNKIIDFSDNMIFKPVRTYNCIIKLNKKDNNEVSYKVIKKVENIETVLEKINYDIIDINRLDENGWKLVDKNTLDNIKKIESQKIAIKDFIRTGIATLRDNVYLISKDEQGFFKIKDDKRFDIEKDIVKAIYKIPDLKSCDNPDEVVQYIIFPYNKIEDSYKLIDEDEMKEKYPKTLIYLSAMREELDKRDKGKKNPYGWYAYGRTQGLSKYGKKMLFPTFSNYPKFRIIEDESALFCNGYAVFENDIMPLNILNKILNSDIMNYYVMNTSYSIEGGYYCYQKKYIERFSIPIFNEKEFEILKNGTQNEINNLLLIKYDLKIKEE